jgi:hypothetical protein
MKNESFPNDEVNAFQTVKDIIYLADMTKQINTYFTYIFIPIGLISNLLTFMIYSSSKLNTNNNNNRSAITPKATNMTLFGRFLAISNVITLLHYLLVIQSNLIFDFDFSTYSDESCRFLMYTRRSIHSLSPLVETMTVFDRFLSVVCFNKKKKRVFKRFKSKKLGLFLLTALIYLIYLMLNVENLFYYVQTDILNYTLNHTNKRLQYKQCLATQNIELFAEVVLILFRSFLPIAFMIIFNALIIKELYKYSFIRRQQQQRKFKNETKKTSTINIENSIKRDSKFTKNVIIMNSFFILFNLPTSIVYIVKNSLRFLYNNQIFYKSKLFFAQIRFARMITFNFSIIYYVLFFWFNFYFNRLFRQQVKAFYSNFFSLDKNNKISEAKTDSKAKNEVFTISN